MSTGRESVRSIAPGTIRRGGSARECLSCGTETGRSHPARRHDGPRAVSRRVERSIVRPATAPGQLMRAEGAGEGGVPSADVTRGSGSGTAARDGVESGAERGAGRRATEPLPQATAGAGTSRTGGPPAASAAPRFERLEP